MADVKKRERNQSMMELSPELVEEILSWAPAKSLALMKSTCKQCKTLIEDPKFVDKHFSRLRGREQHFTVVTDVPEDSTSSEGSRVSCIGIDFNNIRKPCLDVQVFEPGYLVHSICHCEGLLLWVMKTKLLLLNPLLHRGKLIQRVKPLYGHDRCEDEYGLGYVRNPSRSSNDYKIVRFSCETIRESELWVYDFKSDGWNEVVAKKFDGFFGSPLSSVCLRGTPYWIGLSKHGATIYSIQSFDFERECFEPLCLPPTTFEWGASLSLGIFSGDHIFLLHQSHLTGKIHLWVKKKQWNMMMTVVIPELTMFQIYSSHLIENNRKLVISGRHFETKSVSIYIAGENEDFQKVEYRSRMNGIIRGCNYVPSLIKVPGFS